MTSRLPRLDQSTPAQAAFSTISIAAAFLLLMAVAFRLATQLERQWWIPIALVGGIAAADFLSGLVHWAADTWGNDELPVIGSRLLVPFRVHHINPDDFLRRTFLDTNGDVALLAVPALAGLLTIRLDTTAGDAIGVFGLGCCGIGMMTNQIHQWAHMPSPPWPVRLLQDCHLILGPAAHAAHHARPYDVHYCITTGWCNRPLEAIGFFRGLERAITMVSHATPRGDDRRYEEHYLPSRGAGAEAISLRPPADVTYE